MVALLACCLCVNAQPTTVAPDDAIIKRLVTALGDGDPDVRQNIALALAKIGSDSITPLSAALTDPNAERRAGAAYALGLIGESANAAIPSLLNLLDDVSVDVRRQASYAVSRIVPSGRSER